MRRVLWMTGAGHSGSTLLGMMLGAHPEIFYAGEAKKAAYLHDERKPLRKRQCKLCGADCPVWGDFPAVSMDRLYETLSARVGRSVIVDSTKGLGWLRARSQEAQQRPAEQGALVLLSRDGRAVVNSRLRKYPDRALDETIIAWRDKMVEAETFYASFDGPKGRLRYEDLVRDPEPSLTGVLSLLDLAFDPACLRFQESEQHPLGGNNGTQSQLRGATVAVSSRHAGYYNGHPAALKLDLRWQEEMSPQAQSRFELLAGETNQRYRDDGGTQSSSEEEAAVSSVSGSGVGQGAGEGATEDASADGAASKKGAS